MIEMGSNVTVNKNLKSGRVVGRVIRNDDVIYYVRLVDFITKKILGDFVYTEKQLSIRT